MAAFIMCLDEVLDDDDGNPKVDNILIQCALLATTLVNTTPITHFFFYAVYR